METFNNNENALNRLRVSNNIIASGVTIQYNADHDSVQIGFEYSPLHWMQIDEIQWSEFLRKIGKS